MTLILSHCSHGDYVLLTSDTLMRGTEIPESGIIDSEEKNLTTVRHARKVHKLTKYVYAGLSGSYGYIEPVYEVMQDKIGESGQELYLDDLEPILKESIREVDQMYADNKIYQLNRNKDLYTLQLTGFYRDGATGFYQYRHNTVNKIKSQEKQRVYALISPSEDLAKNEKEIFTTDAEMLKGNPLENRIQHFFSVHAAAALSHPELISTTVNVDGLINLGDEGIQSFEMQYDVSDVLKKLKAKEEADRKKQLMRKAKKKKKR